MPSKQVDDVIAVEDLVHEIRENLRLKARPSHHNSRTARPSPYQIPCRSWSEPVVPGTFIGPDGGSSSSMDAGSSDNNGVANEGETSNVLVKQRHHLNRKSKEDKLDDPYELLQSLLKNNSLVKEAVRRLQHGLSPKQRYFYESDEESRSPVNKLVVMCQLES